MKIMLLGSGHKLNIKEQGKCPEHNAGKEGSPSILPRNYLLTVPEIVRIVDGHLWGAGQLAETAIQ